MIEGRSEHRMSVPKCFLDHGLPYGAAPNPVDQADILNVGIGSGLTSLYSFSNNSREHGHHGHLGVVNLF